MKNYSNYTREIKQNVLTQFIYEHSLPFKGKKYTFIDLNGGRGEWEYSDGYVCQGSPLLFQAMLKENKVDYTGYIFESNHEYFTHVNNVLRTDNRITLIKGNNDIAKHIDFGHDGLRGIVYHDLCKPTEMKLDLIESLQKHTDYDILIHLSATDLKRILSVKSRYSLNYKYQPFTIQQVIDSLVLNCDGEFENIFVSGPYGPRQWIFILAINHPQPSYENFTNICSEDGKLILNKVQHFKEKSVYYKINLQNQKIKLLNNADL